jgi:hypothetical protein
VEASAEMLDNGDSSHVSDVTDIFGGERNPISTIEFQNVVENKKFGRIELQRLHDKQQQIDIPSSDLRPASSAFSYTCSLTPPATYNRPHRGLRSERVSTGCYALTQEEAGLLREESAKRPITESLSFGYEYPCKRVIFAQKFPSLYAPARVNVSVKCGDDLEYENTAETLRARRKLIYRQSEGLVLLDLEWVLPEDDYQITWELPSQEHVFEEYERPRTARSYIEQLSSLSQEKRQKFELVLQTIRNRFFDELANQLGQSPTKLKHFNPERDQLSLWAYDWQRRSIRLIAATYDSANPFWNVSLPYGAGVRGRTMRRGAIESYRRRVGHENTVYHRCDGCDEETHLFCVPIALPVNDRERVRVDKGNHESIGISWMAACIGSTQESSLLHGLSSVSVRNKVADWLFFEVSDLITTMLASVR